MNNAVFGKAMENVRNHRDIELANNQKKKDLFGVRTKISPPQIFFSDNLLATEMKRTQLIMNKPVFLDQSILEISKIVVYKFWYD